MYNLLHELAEKQIFLGTRMEQKKTLMNFGANC